MKEWRNCYKLEGLHGNLILLPDFSLQIDWSDESCWGEDNVVSPEIVQEIVEYIYNLQERGKA